MEPRLDTTESLRILEVGSEAALKAGRFLQDHFGAVTTIERKPDSSLVTNLDKEAETIIVDIVRRAFPAHGIHAEERGLEGPTGPCAWVIDPLDGTHNFIRGIPVFGVSLGVVCGGEFVAGIIHLPHFGELYTARSGGGACKNGRPIHVSDTGDLEECSLSFDSTLRDRSLDRVSALRALGRRVFNIRMLGCSTRVLTYLAEGTFDAAVEFDDHPWDFAAGACIVREAGGRITGFHGEPLTLASRRYVGSNGRLHDVLLQEIGSGLREGGCAGWPVSTILPNTGNRNDIS